MSKYNYPKPPKDSQLYDSAWVIIEITKCINEYSWSDKGRKRAIKRIERIIKDWNSHVRQGE